MLDFLGYSDGSEHLHRKIPDKVEHGLHLFSPQKADVSLEILFCTICYDDLELKPLLPIPSQRRFLKFPREREKKIGIGVQVSDFKLTNSVIRGVTGSVPWLACI